MYSQSLLVGDNVKGIKLKFVTRLRFCHTNFTNMRTKRLSNWWYFLDEWMFPIF